MCDFDDYMLSVRPHGLLAAKKSDHIDRTGARGNRVLPPTTIVRNNEVYYIRALSATQGLFSASSHLKSISTPKSLFV